MRRHIVWDWNGTLLDDLDLCIEILNGVLGRRGLPSLDRDRYHELFDFPIRSFYARLGFDPAEPFERLNHEFISEYDTRRLECALHDGVKRVLDAVGDSGRGQSILSAHHQPTLLEIVAHHRLDNHFHRIAGLEDIHAASKLARGRALLDELAVAPGEVLLVGDTLHDLEVARALGVRCALVAAGHHPRGRLHDQGVEVFDDLEALSEALAA